MSPNDNGADHSGAIGTDVEEAIRNFAHEIQTPLNAAVVATLRACGRE